MSGFAVVQGSVGCFLGVEDEWQWRTWGDDVPTLEVLQGAVEGRVEAVPLTPTVDMWLNEEGALWWPVNSSASRLARLHGLNHQQYFGPALITCTDEEGSTKGLGADTRAWLGAWLNRRCTALAQAEGVIVHCGRDAGHEDQGHLAMVQGSLRLWEGPAPRRLVDVEVVSL